MNEVKKSKLSGHKRTIAFIIFAILLIGLVFRDDIVNFIGRAQPQQDFGVGVTINYVDGTTKELRAPNFPLYTIWESNKQVSSFQVNVVLKSSFSGGSLAACVSSGNLLTAFDGTDKLTMSFTQTTMLTSGIVATVPLTTLTEATVMGWSDPAINATHVLEWRIPNGNTFITYPGGSTKSVSYAESRVSTYVMSKGTQPPPPAQYMFSDGFESGLGSWSTSMVTSGQIPAVSTAFSRTGTHSAMFVTNPTLAQATSMLVKAIPASNKLYMRGYFYVAQPTLTNLGANDRFYFIQLTDAQGSTVTLVGLRREGSTLPKWCIWRAYDGIYTHVYGTTAQVTSVPKWTEIEIMWDKTTGTITVWINGVQEFSETKVYTNVLDVTQVQLGVYKSGTSGEAYDPTTQYTCEVYVDDFVIDDARIGP